MAKYLCIWVRAYWFSVTSFCKWLPGGHIRFFGFWMAWFRQRNSSLLWNFSFKFHVHVLCGCRQKPMSLSKWLPCDFEQCHPLLWSGGILVDRWSTISSFYLVLPPSEAGWHWQPLLALFAWWPLTHWGRDKIATISQTTLSIAFSWMEMLEFRLDFHWSLFPRVQLTISQHWFR